MGEPRTARLRTGTGPHGSLGGVLVGDAKEHLRRTLPKPSSWALTEGPESDLWSYGAVDLIFAGGVLERIFCDDIGYLGRELPEQDRTRIEPGFVRSATTGAELTAALRGEGVTHRVLPGAVPEFTAVVRTEPHGLRFLLEAAPWRACAPGAMTLIGFGLGPAAESAAGLTARPT